MTDHDDGTRRLLDLAVAGEPPITLSPQRLAATGRRRLRRTRALAGTAAALVVAALGAGVAFGPPRDGPGPAVPPATAGPGTVCGPEPGGRPAAAPGGLPPTTAVTGAVRRVLGAGARPEATPDPDVASPTAKYRYALPGGTGLDLEVATAGPAADEVAWALAAALAECRTPVEQTRGSVRVVAAGGPGGPLVTAVGPELRVTAAVPVGATVGVDALTDLAADLAGPG